MRNPNQNGGGAVGGQLTNNNDTLVLPVNGTDTASVVLALLSLSNPITAEVAIDDAQGFWQPAPRAKKISANSANQPVTPFVASTAANGDKWEFPLPANARAFRIRQVGAGVGSAQFSITPGMDCTSAPVVGILDDTTSGAAVFSVVYEVSGWRSLLLFLTAPAGDSFQVNLLDDAGLLLATLVTVAAASSALVCIGDGMTISGVSGLVLNTSQIQLPRRIQILSTAAIVGKRVRVEARR